MQNIPPPCWRERRARASEALRLIGGRLRNATLRDRTVDANYHLFRNESANRIKYQIAYLVPFIPAGRSEAFSCRQSEGELQITIEICK